MAGVPDSDVIIEILEEKFPNPSLSAPPEVASVWNYISFYAWNASK